MKKFKIFRDIFSKTCIMSLYWKLHNIANIDIDERHYRSPVNGEYTMLMGLKMHTIVNMSVLLKLIYRFNKISIQNPAGLYGNW